jgi:hypothetical protein
MVKFRIYIFMFFTTTKNYTLLASYKIFYRGNLLPFHGNEP